MISKEVKITNAIGLHARPATFFIQKANTYKSSIWVEKDDRKVNAKSLLGVLSLGIAKGMTIVLIASNITFRKSFVNTGSLFLVANTI